MIKMIILAFSIALFFTTFNAQRSQGEDVFVKSWRSGNERVAFQAIEVRLDQAKYDFETEVSTLSGRKYLLRVAKNPYKGLKGEHWKVEFREYIVKDDQKSTLSDDLMYGDKPGELGRDYFPREDLAAFYYPYDGKKLMLNGNSVIEGIAFYPTRTARKFLIDGFVVLLKPGIPEFDEKDNTKIKSLKIPIEISNRCVP